VSPHVLGTWVARWHIFKPKNTNLGKIGWLLQWNMLEFGMAIWSIVRPFGIFYGHLVYFPPSWYIFSRFDMLYKENLATLLGTTGCRRQLFLLDEVGKFFESPCLAHLCFCAMLAVCPKRISNHSNERGRHFCSVAAVIQSGPKHFYNIDPPTFTLKSSQCVSPR
jgi:hypothetical protein